MPATLYLDTARLGQMSPTALQTHCDFVRLMAEDPSSLYTEEFLCGGSAAVPDIPERFPELARWPGIEGLKQQLRSAFAANTGSETQVLLSSRTTNLMQLGIESLAGRKRLLITDLTWPPYRRWIQKYAARSGLALQMLPLKKPVFQGITADDIVDIVHRTMRTSGADSLFLPAVSHTGIRLPLQNILRPLATGSHNVRTVVDASQAYGHIDTNDWSHLADFVFGGCHKWVRAYLPLGVGFARGLSNRQICRAQSRDPLTHFCTAAVSGSAGPMETVNLSPLFTAIGAICDLRRQKSNAVHFRNMQAIQGIIREQPGWKLMQIHDSLSSMMLLVQARPELLRKLPAQMLREMFGKAAVSVTCYRGGYIRISMPTKSIIPDQLTRLKMALACPPQASRL